ncbi:MAG: hypothetical protein LCH34_06495 [Firmicutes bacterium]|nr:hypothetical protein [Bacillota bacterium]
MIKKYLFNISNLLPPSGRAEIIKEIEAGLYDYLEEHFGHGEYSDAQLEAAILSMGHPKQVADSYRGRSYALISGRYFDLYWLVLKIALVASFVGLTFAIAIGDLFNTTNQEPILLSFFIDLLSAFWDVGLNVFAVVTLIFALVQYYSPLDEEDASDVKWDEKVFHALQDYSTSVSLTDMIFEIFFTAVGIAVATTLLPNVLAGPYSRVIILSISAVFGTQILLNCYLLFKGSWQMSSRLLTVVLNVISIALGYLVFISPYGIDKDKVSDKLGERIASGVQISLVITFAILVIIILWDSYGQINRLISENKKN